MKKHSRWLCFIYNFCYFQIKWYFKRVETSMKQTYFCGRTWNFFRCSTFVSIFIHPSIQYVALKVVIKFILNIFICHLSEIEVLRKHLLAMLPVGVHQNFIHRRSIWNNLTASSTYWLIPDCIERSLTQYSKFYSHIFHSYGIFGQMVDVQNVNME